MTSQDSTGTLRGTDETGTEMKTLCGVYVSFWVPTEPGWRCQSTPVITNRVPWYRLITITGPGSRGRGVRVESRRRCVVRVIEESDTLCSLEIPSTKNDSVVKQVEDRLWIHFDVGFRTDRRAGPGVGSDYRSQVRVFTNPPYGCAGVGRSPFTEIRPIVLVPTTRLVL